MEKIYAALWRLNCLGISLFLCFTLSGCKGARQQHLEDVKWSLQFREVVEHQKPKTGSFSMELADNPPGPPPNVEGALPYQAIDCAPNFSNMPPNRSYILYCPNTGCMRNPEFLLEIHLDENGKVKAPLPLGDKVVYFPIDLWIKVFAIPGFCADWYLLPFGTQQMFHTTFIYQPIQCSLPNGKTLQINKKESLGNVLEILLSGFAPGETVFIESNSEGEHLTYTATTDEHGSYSWIEFPQVVGKTKGSVTISVTTDKKERLSATTDWDMAFLEIKRTQRRSLLRRLSLDKICPITAQKGR
jgi:hypothetical protein